jgi:hypothetical protein
MLSAVPFFGVAAYALAEYVRFFEAAQAAREEGVPVCGTSAEGLAPALFLFAVLAGLATLCGRWRMATVIGIPTILWIAASSNW